MEILVAAVIAVAAVAAVLYPLVRGRGAAVPLEAEENADAVRGPVEAEIEQYRAALRAGTVCGRCGRANAERSRFCGECGHRLAGGRVRYRRPRRGGARKALADVPSETAH
jgi:hypothetical protein